MAKTDANQIIGMVEEWYSKLPPIPKNWREVIVSITPWLALIFGIIGILIAIAGLGIVTVFSPLIAMGSGLGAAGNGILSMILAIVASALLLAAFPGTKANKMSGWTFLFWSGAVRILASVVDLSLAGVLVGLIGFYFLFQIKSYYK